VSYPLSHYAARLLLRRSLIPLLRRSLLRRVLVPLLRHLAMPQPQSSYFYAIATPFYAIATLFYAIVTPFYAESVKGESTTRPCPNELRSKCMERGRLSRVNTPLFLLRKCIKPTNPSVSRPYNLAAKCQVYAFALALHFIIGYLSL
jgi:hypothetical protein